MKALVSITVLLCFLLPSCSKVKQLNFRFEITTTVPVTAPASRQTMGIGTGIRDGSSFGSGTSWMKTNFLQTELFPLEVTLNSTTIYLTAPGSATYRIFINDKEVASKTVISTLQGNQNSIEPTVVGYTMN